jgi:hypothetical protein
MITTTSSADHSLTQLLAARVSATVAVVFSPAGPLLMGAVILATVMTGAVIGGKNPLHAAQRNWLVSPLRHSPSMQL